MGHRVELSVELAQGDRLGVDDVAVDGGEGRAAGRLLAGQRTHRVLQDLVALHRTRDTGHGSVNAATILCLAQGQP